MVYYIKVIEKHSQMEISMSDKLVTFCMGLKNRPVVARLGLSTLVNEQTAKLFNFIVTEDEGAQALGIHDMTGCSFIKHYIVNTGCSWSRSRVLNFGMRRSTTPCVCTIDSDFLFPLAFPARFVELVENTDFAVSYLKIATTEVYGGKHFDGNKFSAGDFYGGMYVFGREVIESVHGFDESFVGYGHEERDLCERLEKGRSLEQIYVAEKGLVFHLTHDNELRGGNISSSTPNFRRRNKNKENGVVLVNREGWGNSKLIQEKTYNEPRSVDNESGSSS